MNERKTNWSVAEAKAKFSQVIEEARHHGPQTITRHGKDAVVVVSAEEWDRRTKPTDTLADFFRNSPLRGSGIDLERVKEYPRDVDL
ncbi:MAG: type II toxin-antitoxin system Phd/YefM family antitoxin [Alphaproteobacteria bacterium]